LGGVHGNEVCGVNAIRKLKDSLKIDAGELRLIIANPKAVENNVRYTEENLNRCFLDKQKGTGSYEEKLAAKIMEHLRWADFCLDLHASNSKDSKPFVIVAKKNLSYGSVLPIGIVVTGFEKFYKGGSGEYVDSLGKIGVGVECGYLQDEKSTGIAEQCIFSVLQTTGLVNSTDNINAGNKEILDLVFQYHNKDEFVPVKEFSDFEPVKEGQLIGHDGKNEVKADRDGFIIFCRKRKAGYGESFVLAVDASD